MTKRPAPPPHSTVARLGMDAPHDWFASRHEWDHSDFVKFHGGLILLVSSAILLGGCAIATVQTKSTPEAVARLKAADDKSYHLVIEAAGLPATEVARAKALARARLANKGFTETREDRARYLVHLRSETARNGNFALNDDAPVLVPVRDVYRTSTGAYETMRYTGSYPYSSHTAVAPANGNYSNTQVVQQPRPVPVRYQYTRPSDAYPRILVHDKGGKTAYLHQVTLSVYDLQNRDRRGIWEGAARIRNVNANAHAYLDTLIDTAVSSLGSPTREPSLMKEWLAGWVAVP